ncbi:hypothetical protein [Cedratvirus kamchatka]|uniref:Uncharacterized protein n=1 Tax=Cedratvirus kamchatka TaxID=2716914 RepID=A0A6G8MY48_9VIRU|nr:hypothetical protein [Cedratvirus kamchatka]
MQSAYSMIMSKSSKESLLKMILVDKEFYVLARDGFYKECIWDDDDYIKRLVLHGRKEDLEHFLNRGFLARLSTSEDAGDVCCCFSRR